MLRRNLLVGLGSLIAAPAVVRASSLMPITVWDRCDPYWGYPWDHPSFKPPILEGLCIQHNDGLWNDRRRAYFGEWPYTPEMLAKHAVPEGERDAVHHANPLVART